MADTQSPMVSMENPLSALEKVKDTTDVPKSGRTIKGDPLEAKINIAGPAARTIRRMNKDCDFSKGTDIQASALKFLQEAHPGGRWWLKADGTDIQEGLRESMRNEWSGDFDLGDGELKLKHSKYIKYLEFVRNIGLNKRTSPDDIKKDLEEMCSKLSTEKEFLSSGHEDAKKEYKKILEIANTTEKALFACAWKYTSLTDKNDRDLKEELKTAMEDIGMTTVGFVTDSEFNSLRTQGKDRPVSVIQLIMDAKNEAKAIPSKEIEKYFKSVKKGKTEFKSDSLKSLMAMYLYKKKVSMYCEQGINFCNHLYVPEVSEKTGEPQHEREDHNHDDCKRIAGSLRKGHIPNVDLQAFVKAMNDPNTGLTYTTLTGKRKQSVGDAEKLLSPAVAKWLKANGFLSEGRFVEIVSNWHKASDGRGLTETERSKNNLAMLDYLLEDWMPWYKDLRDYSTMDVNRPIRGVSGFTREVVVALTTNIESQEFERRYGIEKGLPPEHPRAGSTDDVEGIFAFYMDYWDRF
ncbi:uncharacterized protein LOC114530130 [Dendronephthya gigantea]|uniref:uncharacterized protein LOC114530130 n=1 Tax=Dendronephthya gigantea TaxID=151771 RepID=UPI00106AF62D|nr:uncharacterized protein LOC114530130 [Dendronephthya gigantea]